MPPPSPVAFHIHAVSPEGFTYHFMRGHLDADPQLRLALATHPHAQGTVPGRPCSWMDDERGPVTVLPPAALDEVGRMHGNAVAAAVARCAQAVSGHVLMWGL